MHAHGYRLAMNLPYCVQIIVYNTVQPDAPQLDRFHKSFKILEIWKANAASKKMTTDIVCQQEALV